MNLNQAMASAQKAIKVNAPEILTGAGVVGVAATGYLAVRAGRKAQRIIDETPFPRMERKKLFVAEMRETWKCYVPPVLVGGLTVAAVVSGSRVMRKRAAVAAAAYSVLERSATEYRAKVIEEMGEEKEAKVQQALAQEKVDRIPTSIHFLDEDSSNQLCCELWTSRFFRCDRETLDRSVGWVNKKLLLEGEVPLDDFYEFVGLDYTAQSAQIGWKSDGPMDLKLQAVLGPKGEPTLAFNFENLVLLR